MLSIRGGRPRVASATLAVGIAAALQVVIAATPSSASHVGYEEERYAEQRLIDLANAEPGGPSPASSQEGAPIGGLRFDLGV